MTVETLFVNAYDSSRTEWATEGNSPYLHDTDNDLIKENQGNDEMGDFDFANSGVGSGTINSVVIKLECKTAYDSPYNVYIWDNSASAWVNKGSINPVGGYAWYQKDLSDIITSWSEIDACRLYVKSGTIYDIVYIRRAKLEIDYTSGVVEKAVSGSVSASGSILTGKQLSVSGSVGGLGSLLRDKTLAVQGSVVGSGSADAQVTVTKKEVAGLIEGLGSVLRGKKFVVVGSADGFGWVIVDKGEVLVLKRVKVEDIYH